jgi:hypothetical protein
MAAPLYSPLSGYGTQVNDWYYVQNSPSGGVWSQTPASQYSPVQQSAPQPITQQPAPQPTQQVQQPQGPSMDQMINDIFAPTMDYLNQAEAKINEQQPGVEQEISSQYQTSAESLQGEKASGERQIAQQGQQAFQRKEDAASAARRLYGELKTGGQQRFGGATSAGQAYGELLGTQLQRGLGQAQSGYNDAMMLITNAGKDLELKYTTALKELENQKNSALNEARRYFDDKLLEISRLKGEAESNKASARLQELQNLRNTVYSIKMQDYQYQQQLATNYQTTQQAVEASRQKLLQSVGVGSTAYNNYLASSTVNPANQLAMGTTRETTNYPMTGITTKKEEENNYPYYS